MTKKVLVVDDSIMMRTIIRDIVSADPEFTVVGDAHNGLVALDLAKKLQPDLVLLDIEMPELNGIDTLKRLRLTCRAKFIIISSVAQVGSPQTIEARRLGASDVISKPSGSMSLDLQAKRGHEIIKAARRAVGLPV